jgi:hypothetical protein
MRRDWQPLAWLFIVSAAFWAGVAFYSCGDGGPPRPTELVPAKEIEP